MKIFLTLFVAYFATTSLQADTNLKDKHQDDLQVYRMIKENVIAHESTTLLSKRDAKSFKRDKEVDTQISLANIRSIEISTRNKQFQRRERLAKNINF